MEVIWKTLKFKDKLFEDYEISTEGQIRRAKASYGRTRIGKILSQTNAGGRIGKRYKQVILCSEGIHTTCRIHRAMLETFIGRPGDKQEVNHKDGNKHNNSLGNLEYCDRKANVAHAVATKLMDRKGSKHPMARLNEAQVIEIKKLLNEGKLSQGAIGKKFNMSSKHIWKIKHGIRWGHLIVT